MSEILSNSKLTANSNGHQCKSEGSEWREAECLGLSFAKAYAGLSSILAYSLLGADNAD